MSVAISPEEYILVFGFKRYRYNHVAVNALDVGFSIF